MNKWFVERENDISFQDYCDLCGRVLNTNFYYQVKEMDLKNYHISSIVCSDTCAEMFILSKL